MTRRPPRVLLASRLFEPEANAAAFRLSALVRALRDRGAEVTVVTSHPPAHATAPVRDVGAHIDRWPVLRDAGGNVRGYVQYASFDAPLFFRLLFRRFDVIVSEAPPTTGFVSAVTAILRRKPFVYYAADVFSDGVAAVGSHRIVVRVMRVLEAWVLGRAHTVLSVSAEVTDRLVRLGVPREKVVLVGHGIDTEVFSPDAVPAEAGEYFVYTGTMSEVHTPQVFVRAFARVAADRPGLQLRFFGQGVHEAELRSLGDDLMPGRVHFGGVVPAAESAGWIRGAVAALVSLTPGIGYDFAHPTKAYAAAAVGTPVLFAGPEDFARVVREADLGLAVPHDELAVVDAMRSLLAARDDGTTEERRASRSGWARESASLRAVGARGADAVLRSLRRRRPVRTKLIAAERETRDARKGQS